MKIGIASDHAGYDYKNKIKLYLSSKNYIITDFGCYSIDSVDYPDFSHKLSKSIEKKENIFGIQFCGTGNGINMTANKHQSIRAALCWNTEIAEQARLHNNANILTMPARHLEFEKVKEIVDIFLKTKFEGGRHQNRINKIPVIK
jgi:ribose 5-phosphate isomerase B